MIKKQSYAKKKYWKYKRCLGDNRATHSRTQPQQIKKQKPKTTYYEALKNNYINQLNQTKKSKHSRATSCKEKTLINKTSAPNSATARKNFNYYLKNQYSA